MTTELVDEIFAVAGPRPVKGPKHLAKRRGLGTWVAALFKRN